MAQGDWKQFEMLVANVQKELAEGSTVTHNDKIMGCKSKVFRQIDVSIRGKVGQFDTLIVIDCKDHAHPIDVNEVEDFMGLIDDVGAQQGAMVAAKGYTEAATNRARDAGINLYRLVDTDPHKWTVKVMMPTLCDFRGAKYSFRLSVSAPRPFRIPMSPRDWGEVFDRNGNGLGKPVDIIRNLWNSGSLPTEVGDHERIDFLQQPVQMDNGYGGLVPVSLTADIYVERRLYFGKLDVQQFRGGRPHEGWHDDSGSRLLRGF